MIARPLKEIIKKQGFTMRKHKNTIRVRSTCEYPCQWDDLIDSRKQIIATIYNLKEGERDNLKLGITKGKDGIYDIVVHSEEINNEVVRNALEDLGKVTGKRYVFTGSPALEDKIIAYTERLMRPLKKYGNPKKGYDFSKARTPKQKAEVINIWIGEILYEALTYKDVESTKSLINVIQTEIEELIPNK